MSSRFGVVVPEQAYAISMLDSKYNLLERALRDVTGKNNATIVWIDQADDIRGKE